MSRNKTSRNKTRYPALILSTLTLLVAVVGCGDSSSAPAPDASGQAASSASTTDRQSVAFVTNQIADFWNIAKAGCEDAQKDFNIDVDVRMPSEATAVEQKRIVEDLLTSGVKGIAISPVDADNQVDFINETAKKVSLITHDSDAPGTDRLMYIGMDNYRAGRMCGRLAKMALPDGGNVMLFIGRLEQDNSKYRRQGVIDELLDREAEPGRFDDDPEQVIKGEKYTILGTYTDQGKEDVAQRKAADAINAFPELNAMVGLFEYNPKAIYQALKQAGKLGQIKLVGFDENDVTLQAIKDGDCIGTVVQNPYQYGYKSVEVLSKLLAGDTSVIPESKEIDIPARMVVTQETLDTLSAEDQESAEEVDTFWADLKAKKGG